MSGGAPGGDEHAPAAPPPRVRVTAPRNGGRAASDRRPAARGRRPGTDTGPTDIHSVYVRSLIRSQLRLALICAGGFVLATVVFVLAVVAPALDGAFVAGVPVSWLLLGFGVYPLAITVAALYVRAASRNEARYRSLAEEE
ncbi:DUF485 domain-containing protein [Agromyces kandeliae]|uniref:DUF485 domain-containing protein n=1 Tax=Agromyces kandeliae TaxID=2666141 RepID=A0A6L5R1P8_9MICO|nr:hypothetical protein [Agromyces kandeliae]MRX43494.1 hypothetical protein [Agromyces kandeliae]